MTIEGTKRQSEATEIMRQAMYDSKAADKSTEHLEWGHDPVTLEQAIERRKEEDQHSGQEALIGAGVGLAAEWGTEALAHAVHLKGFVAHALPVIVGGAAEGGVTKAMGGEMKEVIQETAIGVAVGSVGSLATGAIGKTGGAMVHGAKLSVEAAVRGMVGAEKLRDAADIVGMELATTDLLELDQGFKNNVHAKYDGSVSPSSVMQLFKNADGSLTEYGKKNLPKLQAACDDGTKMALECVFADTGNKDWNAHIAGFLKAHPDVYERMQTDIAFAKGWDQVIYVKDQAGAMDKLEALEKSIHARDARSQMTFVRQA